MENGEKGKIETLFYAEAKTIMDRIKKIPEEKNRQHNKQIIENLADKFSKTKTNK